MEALAWLKDILLNRQKGKHSEETTTTSSGVNARATRYYYDILSKTIKDTILPAPRYANYQYLLTGHSLGGGIASIVGARIKAIAVTFSAPGVVLSRRKFKVKLKNVQDYVINITPIGDMVVRFPRSCHGPPCPLCVGVGPRLPFPLHLSHIHKRAALTYPSSPFSCAHTYIHI